MRNTKGLVPFTKENQPEKRGRPKGARNRSTIVKRWLDAKNAGRLTVADELVLALIDKAKTGDVPAFKELFDSAFGKLTDSNNLNINFGELTDEQLQEIVAAD